MNIESWIAFVVTEIRALKWWFKPLAGTALVGAGLGTTSMGRAR